MSWTEASSQQHPYYPPPMVRDIHLDQHVSSATPWYPLEENYPPYVLDMLDHAARMAQSRVYYKLPDPYPQRDDQPPVIRHDNLTDFPQWSNREGLPPPASAYGKPRAAPRTDWTAWYADLHRGHVYEDDYLQHKNMSLVRPRRSPPRPQRLAVPPGLSNPAVSESQLNQMPQEQVQQMVNSKPAKTYTCDGQSIKDEKGQLVGVIKRLPEIGALEFSSPQGKPWLRYDLGKKCIINIDPNQQGRLPPGEVMVVAIVDPDRCVIYDGDKTRWDPTNPPALYKYESRVNPDGKYYIIISDATDNKEVGTVTRVGRDSYPSQLSIPMGIPYHLLLISLFLP